MGKIEINECPLSVLRSGNRGVFCWALAEWPIWERKAASPL